MRSGSSARRALVHAGGGLSLALLLAVSLQAQVAPPRTGLTAVPALSAAYNAIFDAHFDAAAALADDACAGPGAAPPEACQLLDAVSTWWQIQLDPYDQSLDAEFNAAAESAIDATTAWTVREPNRAEAWFYLGAAYGARAQWRSLRGERLAAARDGSHIKGSLERALQLDPALSDAYFGLGLYHYYADVAPAALRMLRWLLLLPGGDRTAGLEEMLRAQRTGQLVRSEADYQLHIIYYWYEKEPRRGVELLDELAMRHPHNPHFPQAAADIVDFYIDDSMESLERWQALLAAARRRSIAAPEIAEVNAQLGIGSQLDQLSRSDEALEYFRAVIAMQPGAPYGAVARAHFLMGQALDRLGRTTEAAASYRAAIASAGSQDSLRIADAARAALRAQ